MAHPLSIRDMPTEILGLIFENLTKHDLSALPNCLVAKGLSTSIAKSFFHIHEVHISRKSINNLDRTSARPYLANMVEKIVLHIDNFNKYETHSSYELLMVEEIESLAQRSKMHSVDLWRPVQLSRLMPDPESDQRFSDTVYQMERSSALRNFDREKEYDASIIKTFLSASRNFPSLKIIIVDQMDCEHVFKYSFNQRDFYYPVFTLIRALLGAELQAKLLGIRGKWQRDRVYHRCFQIRESEWSYIFEKTSYEDQVIRHEHRL